MMMRSVMVIVPTYNEAENIRPLTEQILQQDGVSGVIVVDDNSPDGTGEIAELLSVEQPGRVEVIHRAGKLGLGTAYIAGMHRALEAGATHIFTMDADFSHHPTYIPAMIQLSERFDLVIGSRYVPGGGTRNWGLSRQALSAGANLVAHVMLGLTARDCTAGFRCYDANLLRATDLEQIRSNGYSFLLEMLFVCQRQGATVGEVPIIFEDRRFGQSKISRNEIMKACRTIVRLSAHRLHMVVRPVARRSPVEL